MNADELRDRTKDFALRIVRLVRALPRTPEGRAIANQLVRAGTSVGANYRAACLARSKKEFASKIGLVLEESDECCYWLDLIIQAEIVPPERVRELYDEACELTAIFAQSRKTAQTRSF